MIVELRLMIPKNVSYTLMPFIQNLVVECKLATAVSGLYCSTYSGFCSSSEAFHCLSKTVSISEPN